MEKDARVVLRLRAADVAKIDRLAGRRGRSGWIRGVIEEVLLAEERHERIQTELAKVSAQEQQLATAQEAQRQDRIDRMHRNAK